MEETLGDLIRRINRWATITYGIITSIVSIFAISVFVTGIIYCTDNNVKLGIYLITSAIIGGTILLCSFAVSYALIFLVIEMVKDIRQIRLKAENTNESRKSIETVDATK
mgnify:CR=1 FL=1